MTMPNGDPGSFFKVSVDLFYSGFDLENADKMKVYDIPGKESTRLANLAHLIIDQQFRLLKPALAKKIGKDYNPHLLELGRKVVRLIMGFQRDLA